MKYYSIRSPGLKCRICGKDIPERINTDVCLDCRKMLDKQRYKERQAYTKMLTLRDTVLPHDIKDTISKKTGTHKQYAICPHCGNILDTCDAFCRYCGQRMMSEEEYRKRCHKK